MAHNFRYSNIVGQAIYVSKAGNDANSGLTPDLPKATIGAALALANTMYQTATNFTVIVGAGVYEEAISQSLRGATAGGSKVVADGEVVFRGNGANSCSIAVLSSIYTLFEDIRFENYANITLNHYSNKCRFRNIGTIGFNGNVQQYAQMTDIITINNASNMYNSIFVNCFNINAASNFYNNYTNASTNINTTSSTNRSFDFNNIMGTVKVGTDATVSLTAHKAAYVFNQNSINLPPKFNGSSRYDFTLQLDSPHIGAGMNGLNIGGTMFGIPFVSQLADCWKTDNGATLNGLELSGTDFIIKAGFTSGTITSAPVKLFANPTVIAKIDYLGFMLFNKSMPGGSATNNNVPDSIVVASGDASGGGNPDRLSYQMRFTDNDTMPGSEGDWTNNFLGAAAAWLHFECNAKPLVDNAGIGNGSQNFNPAVVYEVAPIWVQWRITLTNSYV